MITSPKEIPLDKEISVILTSTGFHVLPLGLYDPRRPIKSCFDIAARKANLFLMIKIFPNIDKIPLHLIEELKLIAASFEAHPIIIGLNTRSKPLRDGVVYERRGLPAMNLTTFNQIIRENALFAISRKGGIYVKVDAKKISKLRAEKGYSLREIATKVGVSRKAAYLFERMDQIKERNLQQLEKLFEESFKLPIDILNWEIELKEIQLPVEETEFQMEIKEDFEDIGCTIDWLKKAPFDGLVSDKEETHTKPEESCLITALSVLPVKKKTIQHIQMISDIAKYAKKLSLFIIEEGKLSPIENVLILQKQILEKMDDIKDLYKLLKKVKRDFF